MKHFFLILSVCLPAYAMAAAGPQVCESSDRALVEDHVHAYVSLAERYPNDFGKYASCKGQPVNLESEVPDGEWMGAPMYSYTFSVQCGSETYRYSYGYILRNGCELLGE